MDVKQYTNYSETYGLGSPSTYAYINYKKKIQSQMMTLNDNMSGMVRDSFSQIDDICNKVRQCLLDMENNNKIFVAETTSLFSNENSTLLNTEQKTKRKSRENSHSPQKNEKKAIPMFYTEVKSDQGDYSVEVKSILENTVQKSGLKKGKSNYFKNLSENEMKKLEKKSIHYTEETKNIGDITEKGDNIKSPNKPTTKILKRKILTKPFQHNKKMKKSETSSKKKSEDLLDLNDIESTDNLASMWTEQRARFLEMVQGSLDKLQMDKMGQYVTSLDKKINNFNYENPNYDSIFSPDISHTDLCFKKPTSKESVPLSDIKESRNSQSQTDLNATKTPLEREYTSDLDLKTNRSEITQENLFFHDPDLRRKRAFCDLNEKMRIQMEANDSYTCFQKLMRRGKQGRLQLQATFDAEIKEKPKQKQEDKSKSFLQENIKSVVANRTYELFNRKKAEENQKKRKHMDDLTKRYSDSLWFSKKSMIKKQNNKTSGNSNKPKSRKSRSLKSFKMGKSVDITEEPNVEQIPRRKRKMQKGKENFDSQYNVKVKNHCPPSQAEKCRIHWIRTHLKQVNTEKYNRRMLKYCDILDEITPKDVLPLCSEYPKKEHCITEDVKPIKSTYLYGLVYEKDVKKDTLKKLVKPVSDTTDDDSEEDEEDIAPITPKSNTRTDVLRKLMPYILNPETNCINQTLTVMPVSVVYDREPKVEVKPRNRKKSRISKSPSPRTASEGSKNNKKHRKKRTPSPAVKLKSRDNSKTVTFLPWDPNSTATKRISGIELKSSSVTSYNSPKKRPSPKLGSTEKHPNSPPSSKERSSSSKNRRFFTDLSKTKNSIFNLSGALDQAQCKSYTQQTKEERKIWLNKYPKSTGERLINYVEKTQGTPPPGFSPVSTLKNKINRSELARNEMIGMGSVTENRSLHDNLGVKKEPSSRRFKVKTSKLQSPRRESKSVTSPTCMVQRCTDNRGRRIMVSTLKDGTSHFERSEDKSLQPTPSHQKNQKPAAKRFPSIKERNEKIQGNIQKAIEVIEAKMVDLLSDTRSGNSTAFETMEKEITHVLSLMKSKNGGNEPVKNNDLAKISRFKANRLSGLDIPNELFKKLQSVIDTEFDVGSGDTLAVHEKDDPRFDNEFIHKNCFVPKRPDSTCESDKGDFLKNKNENNFTEASTSSSTENLTSIASTCFSTDVSTAVTPTIDQFLQREIDSRPPSYSGKEYRQMVTDNASKTVQKVVVFKALTDNTRVRNEDEVVVEKGMAETAECDKDKDLEDAKQESPKGSYSTENEKSDEDNEKFPEISLLETGQVTKKFSEKSIQTADEDDEKFSGKTHKNEKKINKKSTQNTIKIENGVEQKDSKIIEVCSEEIEGEHSENTLELSDILNKLDTLQILGGREEDNTCAMDMSSLKEDKKTVQKENVETENQDENTVKKEKTLEKEQNEPETPMDICKTSSNTSIDSSSYCCCSNQSLIDEIDDQSLEENGQSLDESDESLEERDITVYRSAHNVTVLERDNQFYHSCQTIQDLVNEEDSKPPSSNDSSIIDPDEVLKNCSGREKQFIYNVLDIIEEVSVGEGNQVVDTPSETRPGDDGCMQKVDLIMEQLQDDETLKEENSDTCLTPFMQVLKDRLENQESQENTETSSSSFKVTPSFYNIVNFLDTLNDIAEHSPTEVFTAREVFYCQVFYRARIEEYARLQELAHILTEEEPKFQREYLMSTDYVTKEKQLFDSMALKPRAFDITDKRVTFADLGIEKSLSSKLEQAIFPFKSQKDPHINMTTRNIQVNTLPEEFFESIVTDSQTDSLTLEEMKFEDSDILLEEPEHPTISSLPSDLKSETTKESLEQSTEEYLTASNLQITSNLNNDVKKDIRKFLDKPKTTVLNVQSKEHLEQPSKKNIRVSKLRTRSTLINDNRIQTKVSLEKPKFKTTILKSKKELKPNMSSFMLKNKLKLDFNLILKLVCNLKKFLTNHDWSKCFVNMNNLLKPKITNYLDENKLKFSQNREFKYERDYSLLLKTIYVMFFVMSYLTMCLNYAG